MLPEEKGLGSRGWCNPACPGVHLEERVEDNRVRNPKANCWLAFRGVKDTLLFLEPKERKEECGGKATPESKDNATLITGASVYLPKCVAHG